jgi:hypothetical protein
MSLLSDLEALLAKYAAPLLTYVYSVLGLVVADASKVANLSLGQGAGVAGIVAGVHAVHHVANGLGCGPQDAASKNA